MPTYPPAHLSKSEVYYDIPRNTQRGKRVTFKDEYDSDNFYDDYKQIESRKGRPVRSYSNTRSYVLEEPYNNYDSQHRYWMNKSLNQENKFLNAELHRLRKIEAGFGQKGTVEERYVHNTFINKNTGLKKEINILKTENNRLRDEIGELKRILELQRKDIARFKRETTDIKNRSVKESSMRIAHAEEKLGSIIERQKKDIHALRQHNDKLRQENEGLRNRRDQELEQMNMELRRLAKDREITKEKLNNRTEQLNNLISSRDGLESQIERLRSQSHIKVSTLEEESRIREHEKERAYKNYQTQLTVKDDEIRALLEKVSRLEIDNNFLRQSANKQVNKTSEHVTYHTYKPTENVISRSYVRETAPIDRTEKVVHHRHERNSMTHPCNCDKEEKLIYRSKPN